MVEINITEKNAVSRKYCYKSRIAVFKNKKKCIICCITVDKLR
jgi:hypothetical protein